MAQENVWERFTVARLGYVPPHELANYRTWRALHIRLIKSGYYHLPKLFQTIFFKSKLSQASMTAQSASVTVCFADGGIAQFPVTENQKSGDIVEHIVYAIGLTGHADYCFQLVEGDFKKPRWLSKTASLEEQGVKRHHILRLLRRTFYPVGYFRDRGEAVLLYPQVKDLVLTGYLNMNREDIVLISALQLVIEFGHQAIGKAQNILQLCVPSYFQQDPEIELDIIEKYDELAHMARDNAQLAYLNLVQSHDFFGAHTFKLLGDQVLVVGPSKLSVFSLQGQLVNKWELKLLKNFTFTKESLAVENGLDVSFKMTFKDVHDSESMKEILQFYTKSEASFRSGYFSRLVCIPVTSAYAGRTCTIECYTCDKVSTLLAKIQRQIPGCLPAEDFCLKVKSTKGVVTCFLDPNAFVGAYNLSLLSSIGLEYDLTIAPVNVQFADGTVQTYYLDKTWDVVAILKYITTSLDISTYGIGLYFDGQLLQFSKDLYAQGFSGDEPIQCYHYMFPSYCYHYELSLELEYARARMLLDQPGAYSFKEHYEMEELRGLARQIDFDCNAPPQARQQAKQRFIEAAGRERVFRVLLGEEEKDLIYQQNHLKIRNVKANIPGNMFYEWPLSDVRSLTSIPDFLQIQAVSNGREVKLILRTPQTYLLRILFYEHVSINSNLVEIQNLQRRGQLPFKPLSAHSPTFNCTHPPQPGQQPSHQPSHYEAEQLQGNYNPQHQSTGGNYNHPPHQENRNGSNYNDNRSNDGQFNQNRNYNNSSGQFNNNQPSQGSSQYNSGGGNNYNPSQNNPPNNNYGNNYNNDNRGSANYQPQNNYANQGGNTYNNQGSQGSYNDTRANYNPQQGGSQPFDIRGPPSQPHHNHQAPPQQYENRAQSTYQPGSQQSGVQCPACHSGNPPRSLNCFNCGSRL